MVDVQFMNSFISWSVSHIHRERNMIADCFVKQSLAQEIGLCRFSTVPDFAVSAVLDDLTGLVRPRTVRAALAAE